jgi:hypothetical protein
MDRVRHRGHDVVVEKLTIATVATLATACSIRTRIARAAAVIVSSHQQAVVGWFDIIQLNLFDLGPM